VPSVRQPTNPIKTQLLFTCSGLDAMSAPAAGAAEERVDAVEISLVLDVQALWNNGALKPAHSRARFHRTIFQNSAENKVIDVDHSV